ncbi:MAG: hypothetical protein LWX11_01340, partial [Firmicutes bacterium]|nr:hypothetical protein [Bacillota bacterium]
TFVALSHLERDVVKAVKLREALRRSEPESLSLEGWEQVKAPLRDDPKARSAFETWRRLQAQTPPPDDPGYLDHFDETRAAFRQLVKVAEVALGPEAEKLRTALAARLAEAKLEEDSLVWKRAWDHHWGRTLCEAWGIPC